MLLSELGVALRDEPFPAAFEGEPLPRKKRGVPHSLVVVRREVELVYEDGDPLDRGDFFRGVVFAAFVAPVVGFSSGSSPKL